MVSLSQGGCCEKNFWKRKKSVEKNKKWKKGKVNERRGERLTLITSIKSSTLQKGYCQSLSMGSWRLSLTTGKTGRLCGIVKSE